MKKIVTLAIVLAVLSIGSRVYATASPMVLVDQVGAQLRILETTPTLRPGLERFYRTHGRLQISVSFGDQMKRVETRDLLVARLTPLSRSLALAIAHDRADEAYDALRQNRVGYLSKLQNAFGQDVAVNSSPQAIALAPLPALVAEPPQPARQLTLLTNRDANGVYASARPVTPSTARPTTALMETTPAQPGQSETVAAHAARLEQENTRLQQDLQWERVQRQKLLDAIPPTTVRSARSVVPSRTELAATVLAKEQNEQITLLKGDLAAMTTKVSDTSERLKEAERQSAGRVSSGWMLFTVLLVALLIWQGWARPHPASVTTL